MENESDKDSGNDAAPSVTLLDRGKRERQGRPCAAAVGNVPIKRKDNWLFGGYRIIA
jgi:hypothetical protein